MEQDASLDDIDLEISDKPEMTTSDQPRNPGKSPKKAPKPPKKAWSKKKKIIVFGVVPLLLIALGVGGFLLYRYLNRHESLFGSTNRQEQPHYYSTLTGEEISSPDLDKLPTYCVQIPNGLDGPRPQAGLEQAAIVFEAIAEAGITRFAAIFQNPTVSAIGPIRSIRPYYLEWDTPFNCTVVHAGGSYEALEMLKSDEYRDLSEDYTYEWRDYVGYYAPNNLLTSSALLSQFNAAYGYSASEVGSFTRMTPKAAKTARERAQEASTEATPDESGENAEKSAEIVPLVTSVSINFGYTPSFNTVYTYDVDNDVYLRAYADGTPHTTFTCPEGLEQPSPQRDCGEAKQLAPKVVVALVSDQSLDTDGYHQVIPTTSEGKAYVFQNGTATEATWSRSNIHDPIRLTDPAGEEVKLVPGQLWVAAIPAGVGSVEY